MAGIRFKEGNESNRDINIIFARREHGDGVSFDGWANILAHAFFPSVGNLGGDAHFDEDEEWTDNTAKGRVFRWLMEEKYNGHKVSK